MIDVYTDFIDVFADKYLRRLSVDTCERSLKKLIDDKIISFHIFPSSKSKIRKEEIVSCEEIISWFKEYLNLDCEEYVSDQITVCSHKVICIIGASESAREDDIRERLQHAGYSDIKIVKITQNKYKTPTLDNSYEFSSIGKVITEIFHNL